MMDKDTKKKIDDFVSGKIEELPEDVIEEISADNYISLIETASRTQINSDFEQAISLMEKNCDKLLVSAAKVNDIAYRGASYY